MSVQRLIYVGDPLCSWCYGFGGELDAAAKERGLRVDCLMGGLRPHGTERIEGKFRAFLFKHWGEVEAASSVPFDRAAIERLGPIAYDTEPACRAVVSARLMRPEGEHLPLFRAIQHAFYAEGRDATSSAVLVPLIGAHIGCDEATAKAMFESDAKAATEGDFAQCRQWGIAGYPALIAAEPDQLTLIASGFTRASHILQRIDELG